jgi:hypothetical protein
MSGLDASSVIASEAKRSNGLRHGAFADSALRLPRVASRLDPMDRFASLAMTGKRLVKTGKWPAMSGKGPALAGATRSEQHP